MTNVDGPLPTHMLAIYPRAEKVADKTQVTLFPIHDIFVAAHCAHVPQLPPAAQPTVQVAPGTQITIPVVPFSVPHPESFPILTTYLYAKRPEQLLSRLLPVPHPTPAGHSLEERQLQIATALTQKYTTRGIFDLIMVVNGLWRNTCALGVFDEKLWCAMELSWQILLAALAIAVGKYEDFVASQA